MNSTYIQETKQPLKSIGRYISLVDDDSAVVSGSVRDTTSASLIPPLVPYVVFV